MYCVVFIASSLLSVVTGQQDFAVVDLTHDLSESTPNWPFDPPLLFTVLFRGLTSDGYWFESNKFETVEHIGTHLDAPAHFAEGNFRTQQIPMDKLCGPGVIINVTEKAIENEEYQVTVGDLKAWETEHGKIPDKAVVIMKTGWSSKHPDRELVFGTQTPDDPSTLRFPGWSLEAANWLIAKRSINVLGVDTPSNDYGRSVLFPVHQSLGQAQIPGIENVANLESIPEKGCTIYVGVLKIKDGSGGPARIFATCNNEDSQSYQDNDNN